MNRRSLTALLALSALSLHPARISLSAQSAAPDYDGVDPWAGVSPSTPGPPAAVPSERPPLKR
jgi:hypothetical protein